MPEKRRTLPVNRQKMKNSKNDNGRGRMNPQGGLTQANIQSGSTKDKFPVVLDGGKTIIFISDRKNEKATIERYKNRGHIKT
jgi:hypothetical protein